MISALLRATALAAMLTASSVAQSETPPATTGPVDGLISSPDNFKLLLENDQVRVLQYTLLPGAIDHWHTHPPRVGYVLSGAKIRVTEADGSHEDYDDKAGEIYWGEFSPLHNTYNVGTTPFVALLVEVKNAPSSPLSPDEAAIREKRAAFNAAIAKGDIKGIAAILADNVQLITGTDSALFAGKAAQLANWTEDLSDRSRGIYVRTPDRIRVSSIRPMALETGHWRGVDTASAKDWAAGDYVAKWRRIDGAWRIESEAYMTMSCGGAYCPKKER